jgi:small nuclear ribonucleoprotein (snRNP)-like protein
MTTGSNLLGDNLREVVDFARGKSDPFYIKAVDEFDKAQLVVDMAIKARDEAFNRLAMQVKLKDGEELAGSLIDYDELQNMDFGKAMVTLTSKGKYRYGQSRILEAHEQSKNRRTNLWS